MGAVVSVWVALVVSCGVTDYSYGLPGGYMVWHPHADCTSIRPGADGPATGPAIESLVVGVAWDARYVLAEQELMERDASGRCCGRRLGRCQFWVLDTRGPSLHGPFDEPGFAAERAARGIDPGLRLQAPHAFVP